MAQWINICLQGRASSDPAMGQDVVDGVSVICVFFEKIFDQVDSLDV